MDYRTYTVGKIPKLTRLARPEDIDDIEFTDDVAEVEVPIELLDRVPIKHSERLDSPRLNQLIQSIRRDGYSSMQPIVCRIGALGNWVVIDGGHRITAAKRVSQEILTNLFGKKVGDLTFILFKTPMSYSKLRPSPGIPDEGPDRRLQGIPLQRSKKRRRKKPRKKSN